MRIATFIGVQFKRILVYDIVRKIQSALNYAYDGKIGYEKALVNSQIELAGIGTIPAV